MEGARHTDLADASVDAVGTGWISLAMRLGNDRHHDGNIAYRRAIPSVFCASMANLLACHW